MRHSFGLTPSVSKSRSKFDLSHGIKTSFNVGQLIPVDIQEVLPGDTFKERTTCVTRVTSSFLKPVMDNLYMDIYHFFVPLRLVYSDFESVFGVAEPSQYVDPEYAEIPTISGKVSQGSIADYFGLPIDRIFESNFISSLPFRAYALIYNKWFRNENAISETFIPKDNQGLVLNNEPFSPTNFAGMPANVGKKKDYFTSVLPKPQKGVAVDLSVGSDNAIPLRAYNVEDYEGLYPFNNLITIADGSNYGVGTFAMGGTTDIVNGGTVGTVGSPPVSSQQVLLGLDPNEINKFTVNDLRLAFQTQRILERDARFGSRYNEYLLGTFGVYSPDMRLQLPEYLGGGRIPIAVQQVAQTSQASEDSPLANVAGYSLSNGQSHYTKGFVEHGYVITLACIRQLHTYSQGVSKMFTRLSRRDFYDTAYANLGEQPVYTHEIFIPKAGAAEVPFIPNNDVLGYNEAWAEYRYAPSKITGQMRPDASASLDIWHFGDKFVEAPVYCKEFVEENPDNVDRTISVESSAQNQFICDFWFNTEAIRVMPVYSVPGLIDHH